MSQAQFNLTGGQGTMKLQPDGSITIHIEYALGIGVQLPVGTKVVIDERIQPGDVDTDKLTGDWAKLAENWQTIIKKPDA